MTTQSVDKPMAILRQFDTLEPALGVSELAGRLGLSKSIVHNILASLRRGGLVDQIPSTHKYRLGLEVPELGCVVTYSEPLPALPSLPDGSPWRVSVSGSATW